MQTYKLVIDDMEGEIITCTPSTIIILKLLLTNAGHKVGYTTICNAIVEEIPLIGMDDA